MFRFADLESNVLAAPRSGDTTVDALLGIGNAWTYLAPATDNALNYTFSITANTEADAGALQAFNTTQQAATRQLMAYLGDVTGIGFVETGDGNAAHLHFAVKTLAGDTAGLTKSNYTYAREDDNVVSLDEDAYLYLDADSVESSVAKPVAGSLGYHILLHEIGHALGLQHPVDADSLADFPGNSIMNYTLLGEIETTFLDYDLAALDFIYGGDGLGGVNFGSRSIVWEKTLTGTAGNDKLSGSGGADRIGGGAGSDKLTGGGGADLFVFDTLVAGSSDRIADFSVSQGDVLLFDGTVFAALAGGMTSDNVVIAAKAQAREPDHHLLLSTRGGKLFYDADGSGPGAAIQIAGIKGNLSVIDASHFAVA